jgi:hypothetical protein
MPDMEVLSVGNGSANDRDGPGQNTALVERKLYDELNEYGEGHFDEPNEEDPKQ